MDPHPPCRFAAFATALAATALTVACSTPTATATVAGIATYRERIALPPDAEFEASLEDVSRVDAPAVLIASAREKTPAGPPFRFTLSYDPARIVPMHRYAIRARVLRGEELLFTSDTHIPLPAAPGAAPVEIMMVRAGARHAGPTLEDTRWELVRLGNSPVTLAADQTAPYIQLASADHRVSGYAGCNRVMGGYALEGAKLSFSQLAGTMMACAQGMELEQQYHAALARVAGWRLEGGDLVLLDAGGNAVAGFRNR
jgi:putative lipoprotein